MSQSSSIAAAMVIAFFVFIVVRGQLPCYMEVLGITTQGQCAFGSISGSSFSAGLSFQGGSITAGSGGIGIQSPPITLGPVTIQPPPIRF